jgi:DMSO/TMAO reductase YedYZ molybdopterin-dependent catalytic subunit
MARLESLPVHPVPEAAARAAETPVLVLEGLVERPEAMSFGDVAALQSVAWDGDFACEEGWTVDDLHWQGVALASLIDRARPLASAKFVRVASGDYVLPLPIETARDAVLCHTLDGKPLTLEQGAPWRLLLPGGVCFTSVKWVDRLEFAETAGDNTAESVARARLAQRS